MGKLLRQLRMKNEGSTLILVLLCMTFLGLLGSVVLTATVSNMKMKTVDSLTKDNFYTTETAVDELKIGLEESAEMCMREAYTYMLQRYSTTPESQRTQLLMRKFINLFFQELSGQTADSALSVQTAPINVDDIMAKYLLSATGKNATIFSSGGITVTKNLEDLSITINGLSLSYTDSTGYSSTITTDIKMKASYPSLSTRAVTNEGVYYTDYALIADEVIETELNQTSKVNGNIYGGLGIHAYNGARLVLNSNKVISRETLEARDKAKITIVGQKEESVLKNSVWVKNIATTCGPDSSHQVYLDIEANCYVQDDLTLGANKGEVVMKGNYYGYQISNASADDLSGSPSGSSSIAINGREATLNLEEIKNLWISGKAYLSVPKFYGNTTDVTIDEKGVLQGNSISFKGNQIAYLIPGNCIVGIGHNPMTFEEFTDLKNKPEEYKVDLSQYVSETGMQLSNYVVVSKPYKEYHIQYLAGGVAKTMVYLYLNFRSADHATAYFDAYRQETKNLERLNSIADRINLGNVILPKLGDYESMVFTGSIFSYDSTEATPSLTYSKSGKYYESGARADVSYNDSEIQIQQTKLKTNFTGLTNYLKEDYRVSGNEKSLVRNLIRYAENDGVSGIHGIDYYHDDIYKDFEDNKYILVTGKDDDIYLGATDSGKEGLIITKGNVVINGCEFNGMIITTGKITLKADAIVNADAGIVKNIIDTTPQVSQFFYDYLGSGMSDMGEINTIQITYENWYKE